MKRITKAKTIMLGSALAAVITLPAMAADIDYPIRGTQDYGPGHTNVEYGSGWYLRGDLGYSVIADISGTYYSTAYGDDTSYSSESLAKAESYSIGAGYIFNNSMRADLTLEASSGVEWEGKSRSADCDGGPTPGDCLFEATAELKRTSLMANGYYTFGGFAGFRPYVGAGVGMTDVSWSDYEFQQKCHVDVGETCAWGNHSGSGTARETYYGPSGTVNTSSGLAFTYALTAGLDYRINKNWLVDMGYKWTHVSENLMIEEGANGAGVPGGDSRFDGIDLHEVRVGLRYEVW